MAKQPRRKLQFDSWESAFAEADRLHGGGYDRLGKWSLGQCCRHVADFMKLSIDGFPKLWLPGPLKWALKKLLLETLLKRGFVGMRLPTLPQIVPADTVADLEGLAELRAQAARFEAAAEPLAASPLFGPLTKSQWNDVHLWHIGHHLGFLLPREPKSPA